MQAVYPTLIQQDDDRYQTYVPDFNIYMGGSSLYEAITATRDAIRLIEHKRHNLWIKV